MSEKVEQVRFWRLFEGGDCHSVVVGYQRLEMKKLVYGGDEVQGPNSVNVLFAQCDCEWFTVNGHWEECEGILGNRWCKHIKRAVDLYTEETGYVSDRYWEREDWKTHTYEGVS